MIFYLFSLTIISFSLNKNSSNVGIIVNLLLTTIIRVYNTKFTNPSSHQLITYLNISEMIGNCKNMLLHSTRLVII